MDEKLTKVEKVELAAAVAFSAGMVVTHVVPCALAVGIDGFVHRDDLKSWAKNRSGQISHMVKITMKALTE